MVSTMNTNAEQAIEALSENSRHFLRSTLDEVHKDSSAGNRNAVIFVAAALEVLLKTRLVIEHWTLLFDDPAKAKITDLKSGDFVSVLASKLVGRLNNVASLEIAPKVPQAIFQLRNRIVHFAPPTEIAIRMEVAMALSFALEFIHDHMLPNLQNNEQTELTKLKEEISEAFRVLDDFRIKRLKELEGALGTCSLLVECPDCAQKTLALTGDDETDTCLFCLSKTDGQTLAERYVFEVLGWSWRVIADGGGELIQDCIECSERSFVTGVQVVNRPNIVHACFSCAAEYEDDDVEQCMSCSSLMSADNDISVCFDCLAASEQG